MTKNLALPWYHRQDWTELRELFVERDCIPADYDVWKERALRAERRYRKKGYDVTRVTVTPNDLRAWCCDTGREIDLNARHEFAAAKLGKISALAAAATVAMATE